jgi:hypothetical protein
MESEIVAAGSILLHEPMPKDLGIIILNQAQQVLMVTKTKGMPVFPFPNGYVRIMGLAGQTIRDFPYENFADKTIRELLPGSTWSHASVKRHSEHPEVLCLTIHLDEYAGLIAHPDLSFPTDA